MNINGVRHHMIYNILQLPFGKGAVAAHKELEAAFDEWRKAHVGAMMPIEDKLEAAWIKYLASVGIEK